ncbi:hypothetical protein DFH08DRAFT_706878, partial [Mycena albidolilacea]
FFEPHPYKVRSESVLSIIRCSDKYKVEYLHRRALAHLLAYDFPTTLSGYDGDNSSTDFGWFLGNPASRACIAAVQLARQVNVLWVLPVAFHRLATTDKETIQKILHCTNFKGHPTKLGGNDQIVFLTCSILLTRLELNAVSFLHSADSNPNCAGSTKCTAALYDYMASVGGPVPLKLCDSAGIWPDLSDNCCDKCYRSLKAAHAVARQEIWNELPGVCGLPPWPELEKTKADALKG